MIFIFTQRTSLVWWLTKIDLCSKLIRMVWFQPFLIFNRNNINMKCLGFRIKSISNRRLWVRFTDIFGGILTIPKTNNQFKDIMQRGIYRDYILLVFKVRESISETWTWRYNFKRNLKNCGQRLLTINL